YRHYEESRDVVARALRETHCASGSWHVIDGSHRRHRNLTAARTLLTGLSTALERGGSVRSSPRYPQQALLDHNLLGTCDLSQSLSKSDYDQRLKAAQRRLLTLNRQARKQRCSTILAFEGWDAGGKGDCIRRLTSAMDAQNYRVIPIAAPTDEELAHHYLWRFWRHLPLSGHSAIFDRSWYGRVMVERIEGFCSNDDWQRAFAEINEFEEQLHERGCLVLKFFLHIDPDEQLRRFEARREVRHKQYKLTDEDFRNRDKWPAYETVVNDLLGRTNTEYAPWHLVAANDKRHARVEVIETVCNALERHLSYHHAAKH
ncbi:MAG: polyphosphate:AMP phosphotransferase, partial [Planctomycetota bacterium]